MLGTAPTPTHQLWNVQLTFMPPQSHKAVRVMDLGVGAVVVFSSRNQECKILECHCLSEH